MKKILITMILLSAVFLACAYNAKPIDVSDVQYKIVKGKTTISEVETMYGKPYKMGKTKNGLTYLYYLSINPLTSTIQDFTFYFDEQGRVSSYAIEYPGGNPPVQM
jgi:hypothetical protein